MCTRHPNLVSLAIPIFHILIRRIFTFTCNVLLEVVCCFRIVYILLNMASCVGSQSYISPPSFMFVSAAISGIRELNQNKEKKNSEIGYFNLAPFLGI